MEGTSLIKVAFTWLLGFLGIAAAVDARRVAKSLNEELNKLADEMKRVRDDG